MENILCCGRCRPVGLASERKSVKVNGAGGRSRPCPTQLQYTACVLNDGARFDDRVQRAGWRAGGLTTDRMERRTAQ